MGDSDEHLIELIKEREVLYNTKCSGYRDVALRQAAWEEISKQYGKTVVDCKDDWYKLRNCYSNAIKRRQLKRRKGVKLAPWRLEAEMSFLKGNDEMDHRLETLKAESSDEEIEETAEYLESFSSSESIGSPKRIPNKNIHYVSSTSNKRKASHSRTNLNSITDNLEFSEKRQNTDFDDTDHFFLSMSKMVKKLPKIDQSRIKLDLHKAINRAELQLLEENP